MRKRIARLAITRFANHYDYDASYLQSMLETAPSAFFKFAKIRAAGPRRSTEPPPASPRTGT